MHGLGAVAERRRCGGRPARGGSRPAGLAQDVLDLPGDAGLSAHRRAARLPHGTVVGRVERRVGRRDRAGAPQGLRVGQVAELVGSVGLRARGPAPVLAGAAQLVATGELPIATSPDP